MRQKRAGFLFTFTKFYVTVYNIADGNVSQISLRLHDVRTASQLAYIVKRVVFLRYRPSYLRQKGDETRTGEKACHSLQEWRRLFDSSSVMLGEVQPDTTAGIQV